MTVESSTYKGLGTVARGVALLEGEGVTCQIFQRGVIDNPVTRKKVVALLLGQPMPQEVAFDTLLERELAGTARVCELAGVSTLDDTVVKLALEKAVQVWGHLTKHDRFVPEELNRRQLLAVCQNAGLKLNGGSHKSANCNGEELPTEAGVNRFNLSCALQPTDLRGRPFLLPASEQHDWALSQGGDSLMSAEEALFLFARSAIERSLPLWGVGWARCRNASSSGCSLGVYWNAAYGLDVHGLGRYRQGWGLGALPREFVALGA